MRAFLLLHSAIVGEPIRVDADTVIQYRINSEDTRFTTVYLKDVNPGRCILVRETPEDIDSMMRAAGIGIMTIMKEHMKEEVQNAEGNHVQ